MLKTEQIEDLVILVGRLDRSTLISQFRNFRGTFPIDFTPQFLETQSVERLRHVFVALCLQQQRVPEIMTPQIA